MDENQAPLTPRQETILRPEDVKQLELLRLEMLRRQTAIELQVQTTTITVTTEKRFHISMQQELEAYAQHLEQWVNQPGRSEEQQQYVAALAAKFRDTFTRTVFERVEITSSTLTEASAQPPTLPAPPPQPQKPVLDVLPRQEPQKPISIVDALKVLIWFIIWPVGAVFLLYLYVELPVEIPSRVMGAGFWGGLALLTLVCIRGALHYSRRMHGTIPETAWFKPLPFSLQFYLWLFLWLLGVSGIAYFYHSGVTNQWENEGWFRLWQAVLSIEPHNTDTAVFVVSAISFVLWTLFTWFPVLRRRHH